MGLIAKLCAYYREYGVVSLIRRIHRRRRFFVYVQETEASPSPPSNPDVLFRVAEREDVATLVAALEHWGDEREARIRELMDAGDFAIVGLDPLDPSRAMCVTWLSRRDRFFRMLHGAQPGQDEICSRKLWVPPEYRRRGLARKALKSIRRAAHEQGARRVWAFVLSDNIASRRLHETSGYELHGVLRWGRRWGRRFAEYRSVGRGKWSPLTPYEPAGES
jgi:RimJ/RimL family protein N-acetyltransferase